MFHAAKPPKFFCRFPSLPAFRIPARVRKVRGLIVTYDVPITFPMDKRREAQIQRHFGDRVRELRKQKGLSQEALALACNLDRTYIGGVERGERNISLINIHKIASAIGVSPSEFFTDAERRR